MTSAPILNAFQRVRPRLQGDTPTQRAPGRPGPKTSPLFSGVVLPGSRAPRLQAVAPRAPVVATSARISNPAPGAVSPGFFNL